jgi:hypothetical protein
MSGIVVKAGKTYRRFRPAVLIEDDVYQELIAEGATDFTIKRVADRVVEDNRLPLVAKIGEEVRKQAGKEIRKKREIADKKEEEKKQRETVGKARTTPPPPPPPRKKAHHNEDRHG